MTRPSSVLKFSYFSLEEFPEYDCYLFDPNNCLDYYTQESFDHAQVSFKLMYKSYYSGFGDTCCLINKIQTIGEHTTGICYKDDVLFIHPGAAVPRMLISNGTVYNERGTSVPTKIVVPNNYPQCVFRHRRSQSNMVLLVNDIAKLVFAISSYTSESKIGGSLGQWKAALWNSSDIVQHFSEHIDGFTMPFGTKLFTIIESLPCLDQVLIAGLIPKYCIVHENNIQVGEEELTVDVLYSVYMMLQSPDDQIVETAFNLLARSKFSTLKYLVKWLISSMSNYNAAKMYRNRSTAFKWLYTQCCDLTSALCLPDETHKKTAIGLVRRITNDGITFSDDGTMQVNDSSWLQNDQIRLLASKI